MPPDVTHRPDDRYVPLRLAALANAIDGDPDRFTPVAGWAKRLGEAIGRVIAQECHALQSRLDDLYHLANPDADTLPTAADRPEPARLHAALRYLLDKANFAELDERGLRAAIEAGSVYGLRVRLDPAKIQRLSLHVRGHGYETLHRRQRLRPWRTSPLDVEVYPRLVVVAQLQGQRDLHLKLFRDIPASDVEALLPHASATMTVLDRLQIVGGGAGSLGGLVKIAAGGAVSTTTLLVPAALGLGGMACKSFFGYRRKKHQRTSHRTQHLYAKNLANNAAVLHTLSRMIALEETKEALLAYALLAAGSPRAALADAAGAFLRDRFGLAVDFDTPDALESLDRLGLAVGDAALLPEEAERRLLEHWRTRASEGYHPARLQRLGDAHSHDAYHAPQRPPGRTLDA